MRYITPSSVALIVLSIFGALLLVATVSDIKRRKIPNRIVLIGVIVGILANSFLPEGNGFATALPGGLGFLSAFIGFCVGLLALFPIYVLRGMGAGDVKLMAMIGAFLGADAILLIILITFIVGGFLSLCWAIYYRSLTRLIDNVRTMIISAAFKLAMNEVPTVESPVVSAGRIPYAIPITVATFFYIALSQANVNLPLLFK
jgi:prepilin peptidase CpaA